MKRPLIATWHRSHQQIGRPRYFVRVSTALPRLIQLLILEGQPRDVIELASNEHGFQVAVIRIHAGGKMNLKIYEDSEEEAYWNES